MDLASFSFFYKAERVINFTPLTIFIVGNFIEFDDNTKMKKKSLTHLQALLGLSDFYNFSMRCRRWRVLSLGYESELVIVTDRPHPDGLLLPQLAGLT